MPSLCLDGIRAATEGTSAPVALIAPAPALRAVAPNAFRYAMPPYPVSVLVSLR